MSYKHAIIAFSILAAAPTAALAQGTIRGAQDGVEAGTAAAGPVGGVVGGAVGAATGTVGGVLGVGANHGCDSRTVHREDGAGDSTTVHSSNCN